MHNLYIFAIFIFVSSAADQMEQNKANHSVETGRDVGSLITALFLHLSFIYLLIRPAFDPLITSNPEWKSLVILRTLHLTRPTNQPGLFYLVFSSASSELFSRLYLTGFDCVRANLCSVGTSWYIKSIQTLSASLTCLGFRCFQFSIEVTKYLSKIKINSKQHQLTLTKAVKASKTMDLFSTRLLFSNILDNSPRENCITKLALLELFQWNQNWLIDCRLSLCWTGRESFKSQHWTRPCFMAKGKGGELWLAGIILCIHFQIKAWVTKLYLTPC